MENAIAIAAVLGPLYLVCGLSLLFYPKAWHMLLDKYEKDHFLMFPLMVLYVVFGVIMVRMYNVWEWNVWLIVTIINWIILFKGVFYMLAPGSWITGVLKMKDNMSLLYLGGVVALVLGGVLSYFVYLI